MIAPNPLSLLQNKIAIEKGYANFKALMDEEKLPLDKKLELITEIVEEAHARFFADFKLPVEAKEHLSGSLPLNYGDKVKCSMSKDYREFWLGTYIAKHPTKNRHLVLLRARPELRIEEELETFAYCKLQ